jgi:hypothetical protein
MFGEDEGPAQREAHATQAEEGGSRMTAPAQRSAATFRLDPPRADLLSGAGPNSESVTPS